MRTRTCLATGLLTTALMTGPAFTGQGAHPSAPDLAPAPKASTHRVTGSIVAVDKAAQTFILRDAKGKTYTLKAGTATVAQLPVLREGERVKVIYTNSDGQMLATSISAA
ncbi:MAG TPA: hypothetical protein VKH83_13790 [Methylomirabilota bacterium]|nr:hypothetical protein [Methylomirabilota bacterium]